GDAVLRAAARAVVEAAPRGALTGRIGGDRLAVLLTRTARDAAMPRAAAIGEAVRGCDVRDGAVRIRVTASVGTAMLRPGADLDAALDAAENALARAKRASGGRVELISDS